MALPWAPGGVLIGLPGPANIVLRSWSWPVARWIAALGVGVTVGYGVLAGELQKVPGDLGAPGLGAEREGRVGAEQDGRGVN